MSAFYNSIKDFSESPVYNKSEWEDESIGERFAKVTDPPTEREVILSHLLKQSREKLIELFFKVAPSVLVTFPEAKDEKEAWARGIDAWLIRMILKKERD